jgi:hypothetical protein
MQLPSGNKVAMGLIGTQLMRQLLVIDVAR